MGGFTVGGVNLGGIINGALGTLTNQIANVLGQVAQVLAAIASGATKGDATLYGDIVGVARPQLAWDETLSNALFGNVLSTLGGFLSRVIKWVHDSLFGTLIKGLYDKVNSLIDWLKRVLKPLTDFLKQMKQLADWYQKNIITPIFDKLQRLRKVLFVFRLLGFKWAKVLDGELASIEAKIVAQLQTVEKTLNYLMDWINFITDPLGVFQPLIFVLSAIQSAGDLVNVLWQAQTVGLPPLPTNDQQAAAGMYDQAQATARARATARTGLLPDDRAGINAFVEAFNSAGYSVPPLR